MMDLLESSCVEESVRKEVVESPFQSVDIASFYRGLFLSFEGLSLTCHKNHFPFRTSSQFCLYL